MNVSILLCFHKHFLPLCFQLLFVSVCFLCFRFFFCVPLVQLKPFMKFVSQLDGFEGDHLHGHVVMCHNCDVAGDTDDK